MAIFALIGHSASGKSTVERYISENGVPKIISYTTRPMRKNEKNGVDYHFIDTETFHRLKDQDFFAETAQYREWFYGVSLDGIDYENKNYVVVVTISGFLQILETVGRNNVVGIHVKVDERERLIRQLKRGDDVDEVVRRLYADRKDFENVEDIVDHVVVNDNIIKTVEKVMEIIETTGA